MVYFKEKLFAAIRDHNMLAAGDRVAVGVSGGADSMCLLDLLYMYADELGIELLAAHVNHCLRGEESDADEKFVRDYCEKRDIPLKVFRADINALAAEKKESTELCARNVRYEFFASLGCSKTATAHTGSDAAETMLMNLARGASLNGLCAIPPVRGAIIRPLIFFTREDTERYCRERGVGFVTDSSNLSDDYTRNRIRHNVAAQLKEIYPSFEQNAMRCMESIRQDRDFLDGYAREVFRQVSREKGLDLVALHEYHPAIRYRVIADFFAQHPKADYENRHIKAADDNYGSENFTETLPGNIRFSVKKGILLFEEEEIQRGGFSEISFRKNDAFVFENIGMRVSFSAGEPGALKSNEIAVDFYKIDDIITIRPRKEGDRLTLSGRRCTKSLKKLFNEMKIPVGERENIPVVCDSSGIIWCAAGGADISRCINKNTKKILIIKTECGKND